MTRGTAWTILVRAQLWYAQQLMCILTRPSERHRPSCFRMRLALHEWTLSPFFKDFCSMYWRDTLKNLVAEESCLLLCKIMRALLILRG